MWIALVRGDFEEDQLYSRVSPYLLTELFCYWTGGVHLTPPTVGWFLLVQMQWYPKYQIWLLVGEVGSSIPSAG